MLIDQTSSFYDPFGLAALRHPPPCFYRSVFQHLTERYLSPEYAPDAVADRCGIPADTIRRIAAELAHVAFNEAIELPIEWTDFRGEKHTSMTGRPVSFHAMRGISAHANGFQTCRALHVLQILLGSVEVPGGFRFKPPYPKPAEAHPKPHAKCTPCSPLNGPHLGFVQLDSCGRIFFHFQLPQIGARHPAATASASSQNHRSPFSILTFVLLYQGDQGE